MKSKKQIEDLLEAVLKQYQAAGAADPDTAEHLTHQVTILDMCKAAADVLSWVVDDDDTSVDGRLTGECDPETLCDHEGEGIEVYEQYIDRLVSMWRFKDLKEEIQKGLESGRTYTTDEIRSILNLDGDN